MISSRQEDVPFTLGGITSDSKRHAKLEKKIDEMPQKIADGILSRMDEMNFQRTGVTAEEIIPILDKYFKNRSTSQITVESTTEYEKVKNWYLWEKPYDDYKDSGGGGKKQ